MPPIIQCSPSASGRVSLSSDDIVPLPVCYGFITEMDLNPAEMYYYMIGPIYNLIPVDGKRKIGIICPG